MPQEQGGVFFSGEVFGPADERPVPARPGPVEWRMAEVKNLVVFAQPARFWASARVKQEQPASWVVKACGRTT
jgi:hypothetical protein